MRLIDANAYIIRLNEEISKREDIRNGLQFAGLLMNTQPTIVESGGYIEGIRDERERIKSILEDLESKRDIRNEFECGQVSGIRLALELIDLFPIK